MDERKPVAGAIRPFGVLGGRYEVDGTGLLQYRICTALAVVAIAALVIGDWAGLSRAIRYGVWGACFVLVLALSIAIVRNGRKL